MPKPTLSNSTSKESPEAKTRRHAAGELRQRGPTAKDAVPSLAKALKDSDPKVRRKAAQTLWDGWGRPGSGAGPGRGFEGPRSQDPADRRHGPGKNGP